jgi:hypothetical protein
METPEAAPGAGFLSVLKESVVNLPGNVTTSLSTAEGALSQNNAELQSNVRDKLVELQTIGSNKLNQASELFGTNPNPTGGRRRRSTKKSKKSKSRRSKKSKKKSKKSKSRRSTKKSRRSSKSRY